MSLLSRYLLAASLFLSLPAFAAALELEVGAGAAQSGEAGSLTGRLGLDLFERLTPSIRGLTLRPLGDRDLHRWALLAELRAHTRGRFQVTAGLGLGIGSALFAPAEGSAVNAKFDRVAPYLVGDVGARLFIRSLWVGLAVGGSPSGSGLMGTLSLGWAPLRTG